MANYLSQDLERIQKRALRIILPWVSYEDALQSTGFQRLSHRRDDLSDKPIYLSIYLFEEIVTDDSHKLYNLLPPRNETVSMTLRSSHRFNVTLQKLIAKREWQSIKLHASTESVKFQLPGVGFLYDTYRSI